MSKTTTARKPAIASKGVTVTRAKGKPSAKPALTAEQADKIKVYKKANTNPADTLLMVQAADGRVATFDSDRLTKQLQNLAKVGASFAAVADYLKTHGKAAPALAKGVESRANPHSAKAVQDQRAGSKPSAPAKASAKAKGGTAKSTLDGTMAIKLTEKGAAKLKANPTDKNLSIFAKCDTVAKALASGLKGGDVNYAVKTGVIALG